MYIVGLKIDLKLVDSFELINVFPNQDCDSYTFYTAKELIIDVILCYQRCKSGKLTADEEKKGKVEICEKLDIGNK